MLRQVCVILCIASASSIALRGHNDDLKEKSVASMTQQEVEAAMAKLLAPTLTREVREALKRYDAGTADEETLKLLKATIDQMDPAKPTATKVAAGPKKMKFISPIVTAALKRYDNGARDEKTMQIIQGAVQKMQGTESSGAIQLKETGAQSSGVTLPTINKDDLIKEVARSTAEAAVGSAIGAGLTSMFKYSNLPLKGMIIGSITGKLTQQAVSGIFGGVVPSATQMDGITKAVVDAGTTRAVTKMIAKAVFKAPLDHGGNKFCATCGRSADA